MSFSWVGSGLGCNVFIAETSQKGSPFFVRFHTGQPWGYLSSPLFALSNHFVVWLAADIVYPETIFRKYALLGYDIVIGDPKVASVYLS